ncbi:ureidoglycolate lyase [Albidovulum sp.]|uniref:ureidoglycolate lyase n=1 Tax=Albidovulum sp. TaxID=1872424 RepID=UPI001DF763D9|nr:ureidoglycolate lyase [Paracoccaceae bacterium]HPE27190.1 ureidoglycolate lyase [Albidovulum sp.]MCB2144700.1 ureidoglycolate lyase [Paracoccaceae bacterium]MCB2158693.1 ureidoglycolate lyase [Paracoccaceae bacterium]MCO5127995.1 ureidoglycolate lyase [Paracoccaceae bacterium]
MSAPVYMFDAAEKPSLPLHKVPLVEATAESLKGYGHLVDDHEGFEIEITRWPAQGWRPVDDGTGDEGGWVEGIFRCDWRGDVLYGENEAVRGNYVLGWSADPQKAQTDRATGPRDKVLLWHMNYHPDGGQLFFPLDRKPFVVPLALPGDDLTPDKVVAFWCDGSKGLYIHANIWHEGVFPVEDRQRFLDRQGRVHARVSADIGTEFGVYLSVPLCR